MTIAGAPTTKRNDYKQDAHNRGFLCTYGGIVDVVVSSDHAQVKRREVHLFLNGHTLGLLQISQSILHQL